MEPDGLMDEWMNGKTSERLQCVEGLHRPAIIFMSSHITPHTLTLPAAHQPMPLGTKTSVGAIGIDAVTPNAGRREVTFINVCRDQGLETIRG